MVPWQFCDGALERNQKMAASINLENQLKDLVIEENTEETEVVSEKGKETPPPSLPPLEAQQAKVECCPSDHFDSDEICPKSHF